jgi:putative FmdB family regulatory protein
MGFKVFDYQCNDCLYQWEEYVKTDEEPKNYCEECRSTNVERLVSAPKVNFNYGPYKKFLRNT